MRGGPGAGAARAPTRVWGCFGDLSRPGGEGHGHRFSEDVRFGGPDDVGIRGVVGLEQSHGGAGEEGFGRAVGGGRGAESVCKGERTIV